MAQHPRTLVTVDSIMPGAHDLVGATVRIVFQKHAPHYAIYSTDLRLGIQFADDEEEQKAQRKLIADLYSLRGEINGLVNGWRRSKSERKYAAAGRYDRRVADALTIGLEGDIANAHNLLAAAKQDLINERTGNARVQYLLVASATILAVFLIIGILSRVWIKEIFGLPDYAPAMLVACWSGTLGAFFSIAIAIRNRTVLTDLHFGNNAADAILRIAIGLIAAFILICLVKTKAVTLFFGDATVPHGDDYTAIIVGFLAGFSERLLPDLLAKAAAGATLASADPPRTPTPAAGQTAATQAAAAQTNAQAAAAAAVMVAPGPEGHADHCICDNPVQPAEITPDTELPQAYGGVAAPVQAASA